ncbi:MAG: SurA N-terminal domain-containing protein [Nitrospiraceae bacterium]|nr:SurA N-terminal domain-containing protein [Nitrospiraceae bacterium]
MKKSGIVFLAVLVFWAPAMAWAKVIDRTVAFVNNEAILLSELDARYQKAKQITPDITRQQVLNTMINRALLVQAAKKIFPETTDEDKLIRDYIDLKVRAFIKISGQEVRDFYDGNRKNFGSASFDQVKDRIESLLEEQEVNRRLESHIQALRSKAWVEVFLEGPPPLFH